MKKVLGLTLGAGLAIAAVPSYAMDDFVENVGIYGAGLYTKPSNNGLDIGSYQNIPSGTGTTATGAYTIDPFNRALLLSPKYKWDYSLGISYHIPCTDTRAYIEYDRFHDGQTRQAGGVDALNIGPSPANSQTTFVSANVAEKAQAYRFGLTHVLPFGEQFFVDLAAYFEYNKLNRGFQESNLVTNVITGAFGTLYGEENNRVRGWGPGVGLRIAGIPFNCMRNFSIFAGTMVTVFYGTNSYNSSQVESAAGVNTTTLLFQPETSHSLLTKVNLDLGMDWRQVLSFNGCKFESGLTFGLRYLNITNAFKNGNTAPLVYRTNIAGVPFTLSPSTEVQGVGTDWGRVGPYLQVRLGGANA